MSAFWIVVIIVVLVLIVVAWVTREPEKTPTKRSEKEAAPSPEPPRATAKGASAKTASPKSASAKATEPAPAAAKAAPAKAAPAKAPEPDALPRMEYEEDEGVDPTKVASKTAVSKAQGGAPIPAKRIVYDEDAVADEPTHADALILVTATHQTDKGLKRKRNEDSLLVMQEEGVFVVADGMGGYRGGEIASGLAVKTMQKAFQERNFEGEPHPDLPIRASELVRALQAANAAILAHAEGAKELEGMGTTVCAARFSANKQRLFVAHVGDSRMYRFRNGRLRQITSDHTMRDHGVTGEGSAHLSRAVGIWPMVLVDVILGVPEPGDIYLLCSDGLTKMVRDEAIAEILGRDLRAPELVEALVAAANARGGKDNITVIVIAVSGSLQKEAALSAAEQSGPSP